MYIAAFSRFIDELCTLQISDPSHVYNDVDTIVGYTNRPMLEARKNLLGNHIRQIGSYTKNQLADPFFDELRYEINLI